MPFVSDGDSIDEVMQIALGNRAIFMSLDGTTAWIADAGDRNAVDRKMRCADAFDLATVARGVTETNGITHGSALLRWPRNVFLALDRGAAGWGLCRDIGMCRRIVIADQFPHSRRAVGRALALELLP